MNTAERRRLEEPVIVPHETTLELYRKMLTVYYVEERMKVFVKQGKCSFNASTRGHEKAQIGMTMLLRPGFDWFFPYYRSKALAIGLGLPLKDLFLGMLSRQGDPRRISRRGATPKENAGLVRRSRNFQHHSRSRREAISVADTI